MTNLKAYFSVGGCSFAGWLGSDSIAYISSGPQGKSLVAKNIENGTEEVLFTSKEAIRGLSIAPTGDIFFGIDTGGAENVQIHCIRRGQQAPRAITNDPTTVYQMGGLLPDGRTFVAACNGRVKSTFDIVAIDIQTQETRIVRQNQDNYNMPAGLSPDGRYLLVNKLLGSSNNALWMVDTGTGDAVKTPDTGAVAAYGSAAWKNDCSGFYLTSDEDSDFAYVAYYDLAAKTFEKLLSFDWDVESIALSSDDRYLAININEAGYSSLRIYDLKSKVFVNAPQPPKGVIPGYYSLKWAKGANRLLFSFGGATRTQDCWVLDLEADSLRKVTQSYMAGLTAEDFTEPTLHSFKSFDGLEVPYFLYAPKGKSKNMPVMIEIHGGPEGQSTPGIAYKELVHYMVSQGVAVVEPNIRGSSGYGKHYGSLDDVEKRLDSVKDIECLIAHITEAGIADKDRIGVMGVSYGGFMTLSCAARMPKLLACAVCTVGMFNLVTFLENTADYRRPHRESEYGTLANHRDILFNVSPIAKVDDITGPLMIIHGQNDPRVPVSEAHQAKEYLAGRGVDVEMLIYPDEGHGLQKLPNKLDCYPRVMEFIGKHMKL